jgi:hypothetical protein
MPSEKTEWTWKGPECGNKFAIDQARLKPFGSNKSANLLWVLTKNKTFENSNSTDDFSTLHF